MATSTSATPAAARRRTLLLAWAAILAQVVFLGGWILAGILEPHYSAIRQYDSFTGYKGLEERLWAFVAQAKALVCATVLILEATLTPGRLQAYEASVPRGGSAEPTFGEAWHNNHHAFPTSAHHGLSRRQLDPGGWLIDGLERLGLAWDVVRTTPSAQRAKLATSRRG